MTSPTADNVQAWLVSRLAELRGIDPRTIDVRERFSRYGLDSLGATGLLTELAAMLGRVLPPTLVWEYPTIESLAKHLTTGGGSASTVAEARGPRVGFEEPIAIVGMACRFPQAPNVVAYWRLLREGIDAIAETPKDRWDLHSLYDPDLSVPGKMSTRWGGFLDQVDQFDPQFFGISPREAIQMDPQQRLVLELAWEALEDAGIPPLGLRDSRTGVFMGAMWTDYAKLTDGGLDYVTQHTATGQDLSIIPARISYVLGLRGPSMVVNTACSSSLVAIHLARQSLLAGESELALAGGVNLLIAPHSTVTMSKFGAMAPDGRSKAFDARANGYVRGEGAGVVVLERLSRAVALGHPIHAVILGSAVNNDGFSNGLTAPSPKAQELVLLDAYASARVDPADVQYIETHGTGTMLGDPIEAGALGAAIGVAHSPERPLLIGSVKTNLGHLEAAAGAAGLFKVVLSLRHRSIPASLHYQKPNPHIPFEALHVKVQSAFGPWPEPDRRAIAGVSSFGFGGTNCHVVLEGVREERTHLLPISAATEDELRERTHWLREVASTDQAPPLVELCAAVSAYTSRGPHRVAYTVRGYGDLVAHIDAELDGRPLAGTSRGVVSAYAKRPVFVFAGQGSQWVQMGRGLLREEPAFRVSLMRIDRAMREHLGGISILDVLVGEDETWLEDTALVQPAIFAVQVALADLLRSWGVFPRAVVGQSMGEVAAACVAGCLDLADAARVICSRSRIVKRASGRGGMAVVELGLSDARAAIAGREAELSVAVSSSPTSTVLSGDVAALDAVLAELEARSVFCRKIKVDYASHCPQMDPLRDELLAALAELRPRRGAVPFHSTVAGEVVGGERLDGEYWWRNLREPVLFAPVIGDLLRDGQEVFVDVDPHPLLVRVIEQCAAHAGRAAVVLGSMRRAEDELPALYDMLGALWVGGADVAWNRVSPIEPPPLSGLESLGLSIPETPAPEAAPEIEPTLLVLSANGKGALADRARMLSEHMKEHVSDRLDDIVHWAGAHRSHLDTRVAICVSSRTETVAVLDGFVRRETSRAVIQGMALPAGRRGLVFVFPGQGSQWVGMGKQLFAEARAFRVAMEACDAAIQREAGFSVIREIHAGEADSQLAHIDVVQPMLFAMEVAIAELFRSWGVVPDCVVGHSMGEIAAAHIAGALSLEDAAKIICRRSKLLRRVAGLGAMALVELTMEETASALDGYEERLSVAVSNGPRSTVISGEPAALEEVLASLEKQGVFCRRIKVDVASHSPQMDVLKNDLSEALESVRPKRARIAMRSTVTGGVVSGEELDASYWVKNLRAPVLFAGAVAASIEEGKALFVEISPHPILLHSIEETLRALSREGAAIASLKRQESEGHCLVEALGALYVRGHELDWDRLSPRGGRPVSLPSYPWQRDRYWLPDDIRSRLPSSRQPWSTARIALEPEVHPLLGSPVYLSVEPTLHFWEQALSIATLPYLAHHRVQGEAVFPGAGYVEMALAAAAEAHGKTSIVLEEVSFDRMLPISKDPDRRVQVVLEDEEPGRSTFRISSREPGSKTWVQQAAGKVRTAVGAPNARVSRERPRVLQARCTTILNTEEFYRKMEEGGLSYGKSFRGIDHLWLGEGEGLARVILPADVAATMDGYQVHPALLDACFQALVGVHVAPETGPLGAYVLSGLDRIRVHRALGQEVWVHALLHASEDKTNPAGDVFVIDADGRIQAEVYGLRIKRIEAGKTVSANSLDESVYAIEWRKKDLDAESTRVKPSGGPSAWLFFVDEGGTSASMAFLLLARGETCVRVRAGTRFAKLEAGLYEIEPTNPEHYQRVLREAFGREVQCRGIVHLFALDSTLWDKTTISTIEHDIGRGCMSVMYLVQAVVRQGWRDVPRLWLVTRGAQAVLASGTPLCVSQSTLWGLGRTIALEHPELECTRIDVDPDRSADEASVLLREISSRDREDQVAHRKEGRYVARLVKSSFEVGDTAETNVTAQPANGRPFQLESLEAGVLDQLVLRETTRRPPGVGEVEIQVEAAGLNFVDVMKAMGIHPGGQSGPPALGLECSGRIVAVGEGVEKFSVGQEVVAFATGSFGSHVTTVSEFVAPKPTRLSFAEAASMPVVFMTVYYALNKLARLGHNERVLIHTATGGTGLAAIQLARFLGAEVFATAGSDDKRAYLRAQGIEHVFDSRTLSFAAEIQEKTGGQGIDVVLNTLTGDARTRSLELLAPYGRFVELSKRDIFENGQLAMTPFRRSVSFASVDLPSMSVERPALLGDLLNEVMQLCEMGIFQPLPVQVFPASSAKEAFQLMANAKHIGKVVVAMNDPAASILPAEQPKTTIRPDGAYLITGGVGGLGLSLAQWMVDQGARQLALVSRSGKTPASREAVAAMEGKGARVLVIEGDVSKAEDMARVIATVDRELLPLRGIVHAAGILDDRTLLEMDEERFWRVLHPKVEGAFHLHQATLDKQLDFFILYSSAASLLGAPGQGNYAAANAFLDVLAHTRRRAALAGTSIHWGPFAEVGLAALQDNRGKRLSHRGIESLTPQQGIFAFARILERPRAEVGVLRLAVHQWLEFYPQVAASPFWSELQREQKATDKPAPSSRMSFRQLLERRPQSERLGLLERHILEQLGQVLRLDASRIDRLASFTSLGMDSLMSLELRNKLESSFGVRFSATLLFTYPNPASLADHLLDRMSLSGSKRSSPPSSKLGGPKSITTRPSDPAKSVEPVRIHTLRTLSQAEAELLLEEELARSEDYLS